MYEDWLRSGRGYREDIPIIGDVRLGLGICWESLYAEISRHAVRQGADILVYLSDTTFARGTVTPWYHLRSSAARAIESGRFVVFASQSGPSGVVSPTGEWKIVTRPEGGFWYVDIPISGIAVITPFIRFGNWLGWLCSLVALASICWCWFGRHRQALVYAG
jgi:apolipoprotein N-acyltransferase